MTIRNAVLAAVVLLLVVAAAAVWLSGQEDGDDDIYDEADLAGWCSVARGRDFPEMLAQGFESPEPQAVEVAGSVLPAGESREMTDALLRSILSDPPPEIAADVDASLGVLLRVHEDLEVPGPDARAAAIDAAERAQDHVDRHC